jgi:predicted MFS family arabinose efflux permease
MPLIDRGRANLALSAAAFAISSAGSVLLHIVLAVSVYAHTGSGLMTALFVSLQWLPALLVVLVRSDWDHGMHPRTRWLLLDLAAAAMTLPLLPFIEHDAYLPVALLLLLRGLVDHVNRINKAVAARVLFPKAKSTHYASFLQSSYHAGIGLAAVAGIFLANHVDLRLLVLVDAATYLVSAALIAFTRGVEAPAPAPQTARRTLAARAAEYRDALRADRRLLACAVLPPLTATFFQGSYSALQPIFPIRGLGLDASAVSASYVLASVAIIAGSSGFSLLCRKLRLYERDFSAVKALVLLLSVLAAGFYILSVTTHSPAASGAGFFLMILVFEFVWMTGYTGIVAYAPKGQLGSVFGISFALGCFFASVLTGLIGAFLDGYGSDFTLLVGVLMLVYLALLAFTLSGREAVVPAAVNQ